MNASLRFSLRLLLAGLFFLSLSGYAQTTRQVGLVARAQVNPNALLLRWTPDSTVLWQQAIIDGYFVERRTLTRTNGNVSRSDWARLNATAIRPLSATSTAWRSVSTDSLMRSALYDPNPAAPQANTATNTTVVADDLLYYRYVAALLSADADFATAKAGGLAYVDETVQVGVDYEYRITTGINPATMTVTGDIVEIGLGDYTGPRPLARPSLQFEFRQANLAWAADSVPSGYYSYWIERSTDGTNFLARNKYPFVAAGQNNALFMYQDTLPAKRRLYYYRLRGKTLFGEEAVSPVISGMAKDSALGPPVIQSARLLPSGEVRISWRYPAEGTGPRADSLLRGYRIEVARRPTDRPQPIAVGVAPADTVYTGRGHLTRLPASPTFYFWVVAERLDGDTLRSAPVFVEPLDTIPPTRPTGLRGTVLPDGKVRLDWNANPEPDLKGYKVLRAQRLTEEATVISRDSIMPAPAWRDTLTLDLLNSQVVYRVKAIDTHFNESALSEPLVLARPDTIPPAAPAFASGRASGAGIRLSWYPSVSRDVARYELSRRDEPAGGWQKIDEINPADTVYTDAGVNSARRYGYLLIAVDQNGRRSDSTARITVEVTSRDGADKPVIGAITDQYDPLTGYVTLDWSYSGPAVNEFTLYRSLNGRPLSSWRMVAGSSRKTDDDFVKADTLYQYSIRATTKTGTTSNWQSTTVIFARTSTNSVGEPPFVALPIPSATATVGVALSLSVPGGTFSDGSSSPLAVSILSAGLPPGTYSVGSLLRGVPTVGGSFTLTVRVVNNAGLSVTTPWLLLVNEPPKLLTADLSHTVTVGESFSYTVPSTTFYDKSGTGSIVIQSTNLPAGLSASGNTLTGVLQNPGPFPLEVTVTDGDGAKTVVTLLLTGNRPPVLTSTPTPPVLTVNTSMSWTVPKSLMSDPEGFSLVVEWLGTGLPAGLAVSGLTLVGIPQLPGSYTLTLRGTDVGGARLDYPVVITVGKPGNQAPQVASLPLSMTVEVGESLSLPLNRDWFFDADGTIASLSVTGGLPTGLLAQSGVLSGTIATPGSYSLTLRATDNEGATVQALWVLVVRPATSVLPAAPTITGATTLCAGSSTTLLAVGCTGLIRWSTGVTGGALVVSPTTATTYSARCEVNNSQSLYSTPVSVLIGTPPAAPLVASVTICPGGSATLIATGCTGQIQWSTGATGISLTTTALTQTTTYTATCSTGGCLSIPAVATVTVGSAATASISGNLSLCAGQSGTLVASAGAAYRWNTGATTASISLSTAGPYSLTVDTGGGCLAFASTTVSTGSSVSISITGNVSLCAGQSGTLIASGGNTYRWSTGATTASLPISTTGLYSLTALTEGGCSGFASATVGTSPAFTATMAGNLSLCAGGITTLTATGGSVGMSYQWSTNETTAAISVSVAGPYSVTLLNAAGCSSIASVTVTNRPSFTATLSALPSMSVCPGTSVTLTASGGTTYRWTTGASSASLVVAPQSTTAYSVTISDGSTCTVVQSLTLTTAPIIVAVNSATPDASVLFSLKAPGGNLAQNNTFVDGSANNLPVTRTGGTSQGSFGPAPTLGSAYFNGSGGLSIPHNTQTNTPADFTWETWFYPTAQTAGNVPLMTKGWPNPGAGGPLLYYTGGGQIVFYASTDGANWNVANNLLIGQAQLNTWQHVAVSRQGSTYRLFFNGVQANTISNPATIFISGSPLTIGQGNGGLQNLNGFLAGTRVSSNARYTTAFSPPTSYSSDANTNVLLTYGNGGIQDVARKNVLETGGDTRISTAQQPLGEGVVTFDGTGDFLRTAISPTYNLTTGDWTVDGWVYSSGTGSGDISLLDTRGSGEGIGLYTSLSSTPRRMGYASNTVILATATSEIPLNVWTHVAWQRRNGVVTGYQNGKQVFSVADMRTLAPMTNVVVGSLNTTTSQFFTGSVYDLRLTKTARYTCDFVVSPTIAVLPSQTVCAGQSTTLLASGGSSYQWSSGQSVSAITVSPILTTVYTVTAVSNTLAGTITASTSVTVVVDALPMVAANSITPDASVLFSLKAPGGNLAQNNTFVDGSANSLPITRTGGTSQGSFGPASGLGSAYFNGSGGLSIPHNTQTNTQADFTWETWFYPTAQTAGNVPLMTKGWPNPGAGGPLLYYKGGGQIVFYASSDGVNWNVANNLLIGQAQLNTWQHIAVSRQGGTYRLFYNGVQVNTLSNTANIFISGSPLTIGQGNTGANNLNGFLAGTRVSNNARYTAAFTPPVSYSGDGNTNVLLTYSNGTIQDVSRRNVIETGGDTRISTAQQPLGERVVTFDGNGDYLSTAINPAYNLKTGDWTGTGNWTMDGWVYQTATGAGDVCLVDTRRGGEGIGLYTSTSTAIRRMSYANNTAILATATTEIPLNVWTHLAWQRKNGVVTGYMNGKQVFSVADTRTLAPFTNIIVGSVNSITSQFFTGSVYDLRLSQGTRYTCDFVVPPTIAALPGQTLCAGQSVNLVASGGNSYQWSTGQAVSSITVSPTVTTVYTVTAISNNLAGNQTASTSVTLTVEALPVVAVNPATPDASVLFSLKAPGVNLAQNNTFVDGSANSLVITRTGGTSQGSFGPATGQSSGYFNGSGGLSIPHNAQTNTQADFTWETWFYPTAQTAGNVPLMTKGWPNPGAGGPLLYYTGGGQIVFYASTDGANWNVANNLLIGQAQLNTWQHVAVSRQGSVYRLFYNGVQVNTINNPANIFISGSPLTIGQGNSGQQNLNAFLAGTRVSNSARYTAAFTPPTTYTNDVNTGLLLTYSNSGVQDITQRNVVETGGDARVSTAQQPLGQHVVAFDGAGDYLRTAMNPAYNLKTGDWTGNGDWTVDGWVYPSGTGAGDVCLLDTRAGGEGIGLYTSTSSAARRLSYANNTAILATANVDIPLNTWTHVAWQRRDGVVTGYMNGKQVLSVADIRALAPMTNLVVGSVNSTTSQFFTGSVYDLRLSKAARYTCDFVVPPTLAVLPSQTICAGQSTTLVASGGSSYVWNTGATTPTLVITPTATTTYSVIASVTMPTGTFTAATGVTIVMEALPVVAVNPVNPDASVLFSLKAPGGNLAQNNTFVDGSANSLPITRTGGTSQGSFGPASGLGSAYFNGSGGLSIPHNTQTNTQADFTWETWFYPTAQTAGNVPLMTKGWPNPGAGGPLLYYTGGGQIVFYASSDGVNWNVANNLLIGQAQLNTWQHVAVSRQGSTYRLFFNGVQANTISNGANIFISGSPLTIGQGNTGQQNLNGFLAGTRVSGNARYTANFTPPTSYSSDVSTNLLMTYGNGGIQDVTRRNVLETGGTARVNTSQQPLSQNVITFNGTTDYLRTAISPTYSLGLGDWTGNGDWTLDGWVYQGNVSDTRCLIDTRAGGEGFALNTSRNTSPRRLNVANNSVVIATASVEIPVNIWTHIVLQRRGSVVTAYQNGQPVFSVTDTRTLAPQTSLVVGALNNVAGEFFMGSLFDLRLRKGAYYDCNFVVPVIP